MNDEQMAIIHAEITRLRTAIRARYAALLNAADVDEQALDTDADVVKLTKELAEQIRQQDTADARAQDQAEDIRAALVAASKSRGTNAVHKMLAGDGGYQLVIDTMEAEGKPAVREVKDPKTGAVRLRRISDVLPRIAAGEESVDVERQLSRWERIQKGAHRVLEASEEELPTDATIGSEQMTTFFDENLRTTEPLPDDPKDDPS
jgi:hypothetical protein